MAIFVIFFTCLKTFFSVLEVYFCPHSKKIPPTINDPICNRCCLMLSLGEGLISNDLQTGYRHINLVCLFAPFSKTEKCIWKCILRGCYELKIVYNSITFWLEGQTRCTYISKIQLRWSSRIDRNLRSVMHCLHKGALGSIFFGQSIVFL